MITSILIKRCLTAGASLALLSLSQTLSLADDSLNAQAREIHGKYEESIVTVKAVIDVEIVVGGSANQSQEQKLEVPGTVIQENGLTVVSNATIDIGAQVEQQISRQVRGRGVEVKTTFKEVNLLFRDGTEIPSKVVLKDEDLDVAFVLPDAEEVEAEGVEFVPVQFPEVTPKVQLLDPIIILNRLGQNLDRELSLYVTKVEALIKKPRRFILTHNSSTGTPAFLASGEPLGLYVRRIVNGSATSTVVLPAKEVARLTKEAASVDPEEIEEEEEPEEEEPDEADEADEALDDADADDEAI